MNDAPLEDMIIAYEKRASDSLFVDSVWRSQSIGGGQFNSVGEAHWSIVVTRQQDNVYLTLQGPEAKATTAPVPADAEFFGINLKLGVFLPNFPVVNLTHNALHLPESNSNTFWFSGAAWEYPTFENAEVFIKRLIHNELLIRDDVVDAVMHGRPPYLSVRSVRRRFLQSTGLTHSTISQIERARQAVALLQQGTSILDTVHEAGYFDQAHLSRSLKHFIGQTPTQIPRLQLSE